MGFDVGSVLVEIAASQIIPALVSEAHNYIIRGGERSTKQESRPQSLCLVTPARRSVTAAIISDTPGRVRFSIPSLRENSAEASISEAALQGLPGVRKVTVSSITGSVLVEYEPRQTTIKRIYTALEGRTETPRGRRGNANFQRLTLVAN